MITKMADIRITREGFEKLKEEYKNLIEKRPHVLIRMVAAREMGDLSENAGYHASKDELARVDRRLRELRLLMKHVEVVEKQDSGNVSVGSSVKVTDGRHVYEFMIVGSLEADPAHGKFSQVSIIGLALIGKEVGNEVSVETPDGQITYKILTIK